MDHVLPVAFQGNPNVGLFVHVTDTYCLVGHSIDNQMREQLSALFKVPVHPISIAGTSLIGVFVSGHAQMLLVPSIIFPHELDQLKKTGIPFTVIDTIHTALGNNIVANTTAAIINPQFEQSAQDAIAAALKVPVQQNIIVDQETVGSCLLITPRGGIIHKDASDELIEKLSTTFGVTIEIGSVNNGVPQVSSGIAANSNGFIIGNQSTGIEMTNADEVLGFLEHA